jgi:hypothetical protein
MDPTLFSRNTKINYYYNDITKISVSWTKEGTDITSNVKDNKLLMQLLQLHSAQALSINYESAVQKTVPSPPCTFLIPSAVKFANIDAALTFTQMQNGGYMPKSYQSYHYLILEDDEHNDGGLVEYIIYRLPKSFGTGWTSRTDIHPYKFVRTNENSAAAVSASAKETFPMGTDCNFYVSKCIYFTDTEMYQKQWNALAQFLYYSLQTLKISRNMLLIIPLPIDSIAPLSKQICYFISTCFEAVVMFRPVSFHPNTCQIAFYGTGFLNTVNLNRMLQRSSNYKSKLYENIPLSFTKWFETQVDECIQSMIDTELQISSLLVSDEANETFNISSAYNSIWYI